MTDRNLLLEEHLKVLRLPSVAKSYQQVDKQCTHANRSYTEFLAILAEEEVAKRTESAIKRRINAAKFPRLKTLDTFDFAAQPAIKKPQILQLAQCQFIAEGSNVIFIGPCGTGKTHLSIAVGHAAAVKGYRVYFATAAGLINSLVEANHLASSDPSPQNGTLLAERRGVLFPSRNCDAVFMRG